MKQRIRNILLAALLILPVSCSEWMDLIPPQGLIREEFWQTKEDVEAVVMGAYSAFAGLHGKLFQYGEVRADMVWGDYNSDWNARLVAESNIYTENWFCDWSGLYKVINYCNEVIANVSLVEQRDNTFTEFIRDGYLSEAIYLRSLAYLYLVRMYKDVPYITEPTESDDSEVFVSKMDGLELLELVRDDLEAARVGATKDGYITLSEQKGRATKASIDALMADISLWLFDYEGALVYTGRILYPDDLEEDQLPIYDLERGDRWFDIFYPGNSLESIFEIQFDDALSQSNSLYGMTWEENHNYYPTDKAIEMLDLEYEPKRGEKRSIVEYEEDQFMIWKYCGADSEGVVSRSGTNQSSANYIIYRLAEIYLMRAEALSQLNRFGEAQDLINIIRNRADLPSIEIGNSPNAFEDAILEEKAIEFSFEGKRWFDLVRMGRRNDYARKSKLIEIIVANVPSTQKRILAIKLTNPLGWYLPIHEREMERNKNLVQNPYYED